jgi:hypothetical protein
VGSGPSWGGLLNAVEVDAFEYAVDALMVGGEHRSCLSPCQTPSSFCLFHFDHGERKFIEISDPRERNWTCFFFGSYFFSFFFSSSVFFFFGFTKQVQLRPETIALVDAFDISDTVLNSALGSYDGKVYEQLFESARTSAMNVDHKVKVCLIHVDCAMCLMFVLTLPPPQPIRLPRSIFSNFSKFFF